MLPSEPSSGVAPQPPEPLSADVDPADVTDAGQADEPTKPTLMEEEPGSAEMSEIFEVAPVVPETEPVAIPEAEISPNPVVIPEPTEPKHEAIPVVVEEEHELVTIHPPVKTEVIPEPTIIQPKPEIPRPSIIKPIHSSFAGNKFSIAPTVGSTYRKSIQFSVKELPGELKRSKSIVKTVSGLSLFPSTKASLRDRGSFVEIDMRDLYSMQGDSEWEFDEEEETRYIPASGRVTPGGTYRTSHGLEDIGDGLENPELLNVDEWMKMDRAGEYLGKRKHFLRIINTMDYDEKLLEVSNFMTVNDVINFYSEYNSNCRHYLWKDIFGKTLHHHRSLGENGLQDYSIFTDETGLDHFPTILLYFKDGFEMEPPMHLDISKPRPNRFNTPCRNY